MLEAKQMQRLTNMTNAEIDKLGSRLRAGSIDSAAIGDLAAFWASFDNTVTTVLGTLDGLGMASSKRIGKSRLSITAKLLRSSMRLSQMQDIVGARIVVENLNEQETALGSIVSTFPTAKVNDKRLRPNHGYRAVHVIVYAPRPFEIQIRTLLQHEFAELVEAVSTRNNTPLKYGVGPTHVYGMILFVADLFGEVEALEQLRKTSPMPRSLLKEIIQRETTIYQLRRRLPDALQSILRAGS